MPRRVHPIDLTGMTFGRLTVLSATGRPSSSGKYWHCRCACGTLTDVPRNSLLKGNTKGCGCGLRVNGRVKIHGGRATYGASTRAYAIWEQMLARCLIPSHRYFYRYGARGITVCERWMLFDQFHADMGDPPVKRSIERIDNNGPYAPENCRWATHLEQLRNTSRNRFIDFRGERLCASEWSYRLFGKRSTVYSRLSKGWSIERALTTPLAVHNRTS